MALSVEKENLKVFIVCSGVLYGKGEEVFHNHFKHAWLQEPEFLPYLGDGNNIIPTIHKTDLVNLIEEIANRPPEDLFKYILAIDNGKKRTQRDIVECISENVGTKKV